MSGKIISVKKIEDTILWKLLQSKGNHELSLIGQLPNLCEEAFDRMKAMPATSPQYTLHDETHFLRVVELMAMVLDNSINELNDVELCLLILAAYYHDQGMVMTEEEYRNLSSDQEFQIFRDNWYLDHPNRDEIQTQLRVSNITNNERARLANSLTELEKAMFTDYLRVTHAKRSADYIINTFSSDKRLEVSGINLADLLAKICESHYSHTQELTPANGYHYDEQIGLYKINVPFIAVVLRLEDILDFDADRTPDVLFRTIHFSSDISLQEWEKHRGIQGWEISNNLIRFTAKYSHPAYHAASLKFMDWVDKELSECLNLCRNFPAEFEHYKLLLPSRVDRSRIQSLNNSYIFHDLEISLSRNEIIKLLMTDKLYSRPSVCIRELLQNSLDALRYRKALFACSDSELEWTKGRVDFLHDIDKDGYEIIQCKDNGVGMDKDIVTRFFTKAGRSFYRSPEFERERVNFKKKGVDYDPCSQFGIGFMSCFMLGDRIKIETRRDYGLGKDSGEPLIIEINGLGGLIVIKKGSSSQEIGTTITITSRKKPSFLDGWNDQVLLTTALKHFAVATEFPITGRCEIEELKDYVEIPTTPSYIPTFIEELQLLDNSAFITIEQDFHELDKDLTGSVRESFLLDSKGLPALANQYASWETIIKHQSFALLYRGTTHQLHYHDQSQISIDGILLCGVAGRPEWQKDHNVEMRLGNIANNIGFNFYSLDVRGNLKPEITTARTPADHHLWYYPPKWQVLKNKTNEASGQLWMKLLEEFAPKGLSSEIFWKLLLVHNGNTRCVSLNSLWQHISVPLISIEDESVSWIKISNLRTLTIYQNGEDWNFVTPDNQHIKLPSDFIEWEKNSVQHPRTQSQINAVIIALSTLTIEDGHITLNVSEPNDDKVTADSLAITGDMTYISTLRYKNEMKDVITVQTSIRTVNYSNPLVQQCLEPSSDNALTEFARSFVLCITDLYSKNKKERLKTPDRWMKSIAHCYFSVDWSKYEDTLLKPPYKVWLENNTIEEITEKDLEKWRDSKINP